MYPFFILSDSDNGAELDGAPLSITPGSQKPASELDANPLLCTSVGLVKSVHATDTPPQTAPAVMMDDGSHVQPQEVEVQEVAYDSSVGK